MDRYPASRTQLVSIRLTRADYEVLLTALAWQDEDLADVARRLLVRWAEVQIGGIIVRGRNRPIG